MELKQDSTTVNCDQFKLLSVDCSIPSPIGLRFSPSYSGRAEVSYQKYDESHWRTAVFETQLIDDFVWWQKGRVLAGVMYSDNDRTIFAVALVVILLYMGYDDDSAQLNNVSIMLYTVRQP